MDEEVQEIYQLFLRLSIDDRARLVRKLIDDIKPEDLPEFTRLLDSALLNKHGHSSTHDVVS